MIASDSPVEALCPFPLTADLHEEEEECKLKGRHGAMQAGVIN